MHALQSTAIRVSATGAQVTSSGSSQRVAIPTDASGGIPRYVRITATGYAYVRPGDSTVTATVNDIMVNGQGDGLILSVKGYSNIAYLQETAAAKINITPLED